MSNLFQPSNKTAVLQQAAQTQANTEAAAKTQQMNMVDQYTPEGSLVYTPLGGDRYRADVTYSPEQQAIYDAENRATLNVANLASSQTERLGQYLGQGVDTSGAPALQSGNGYNQLNYHQSQFNPNVGGGYSTQFHTGMNAEDGYRADFGGDAGLNTNFSTDIGGGYNTNYSQDIGGGYDTNYSRDIGGGYNTNYSGDLGSNYNQQFSGDIGGGYNTQFQNQIGGNYSDTLGSGYQTSVNLRDSYNTDFSAERQEIQDALMQRMQPQQQQDEASLRNQLIQSGLRPGTAAWNSEMNRLQQGVNDARLATIAQAGTEQTRLVNMARDAAGFYNQAQLDQAGFGNQALSQQFQLQNQAALNQAQFGQNAQLAQNQAALGQAQFGQNAQLAQNAAALQQWQTNYAAQQAQNAAALGQAQFGSQQQQNQNQAALNQAQFGSQQQQNQNAAALGQAQFGSQQQQLGNAALQQNWQNQTQAQGLQNNAVMDRANYWNQTQQMTNDAALQQWNAQQQAQQATNAADLEQYQALTQARQQQQQLDNAARAQYMQELYAKRNQPINEISALLGMGQVNAPNFVNTPQTNVQAAQYQQPQANTVGSGLFQLGSSIIGAGGKILSGGL